MFLCTNISLLSLAVFDSNTDVVTNLVQRMKCWGFFVVVVAVFMLSQGNI